MEEFETLSEQLARVTAECEHLREENARLCRLLPAQARPATPAQSEPPMPQRSTPAELSVPEKIALFRSLFRGREDVYAVRWESADGKYAWQNALVARDLGCCGVSGSSSLIRELQIGPQDSGSDSSLGTSIRKSLKMNRMVALTGIEPVFKP